MIRGTLLAGGIGFGLLACNALVSVPEVSGGFDASVADSQAVAPAPPVVVPPAIPDATVPPAVDAGTDEGGSDAAVCSASLATDPANCGACGHDCLGGGCDGGTCEPVILVSKAASAMGIAVDEASVYYAEYNAGLVSKVPKGGGAPAVVGRSNTAWFLAIDHANVYWTDRAGAVDYTRLDGGLPEGADASALPVADAGDDAEGGPPNVGEIAPTPGVDPYGIATDGVFVYWSELAGGDIWRAPIAGGHPTTPEHVAYAPSPTGVTVSDQGVFWVGYIGHVYRVVPDSGVTSELTRRDNGDSRFVAVNAANVYWTMSDNSSVWTVPIAGGDTVLISGDEATPWGIVADPSGVYWANSAATGDYPGAIRRARFENGAWTIVTLAGQLGAPMGIATDSSAIYWTENVSGRVMKLAK